METHPPEPISAPESFASELKRRLDRPVRAVAVDLFRLLSGSLVTVYFVRLFLEFQDYTSENGLLDHQLHRELFWFTKLSLFYPGSSPVYKLGLLSLGMLGAVMLMVGWRPRLGAVLAWLVGVSAHRWNFAVINVDDSSITLLLWWMFFLPIGHTLTWRTLKDRTFRREAGLTVNGFFVRAFYVNLFIYYLTAGLTKLWSPLWKEGLALFVVLQLPLARTNGWWSMDHLPGLWLGNHLTLLMEPLFPFMILLPKGHPVKYFGGISLFVFHLSIPITIGVPYANFALILALALIFEPEIAGWMDRYRAADPPLEESRPSKNARRLIAAYLLTLALAMCKGLPVLDKAYEPAMATLYLGGVAQEYHLFDWIDRFNWHVDHTVSITPDQGEPFEMAPTLVFPPTVRGFIVQSYMLPMRWMRVTRPLTGEMRNSVLTRSAQRFVRRQSDALGEAGVVTIHTRVGRVDRDNLLVDDTWPIKLMSFRYRDGEVVEFLYPRQPQEVGR